MRGALHDVLLAVAVDSGPPGVTMISLAIPPKPKGPTAVLGGRALGLPFGVLAATVCEAAGMLIRLPGDADSLRRHGGVAGLIGGLDAQLQTRVTRELGERAATRPELDRPRPGSDTEVPAGQGRRPRSRSTSSEAGSSDLTLIVTPLRSEASLSALRTEALRRGAVVSRAALPVCAGATACCCWPCPEFCCCAVVALRGLGLDLLRLPVEEVVHHDHVGGGAVVGPDRRVAGDDPYARDARPVVVASADERLATGRGGRRDPIDLVAVLVVVPSTSDDASSRPPWRDSAPLAETATLIAHCPASNRAPSAAMSREATVRWAGSCRP
jgi:hypothetical protein